VKSNIPVSGFSPNKNYGKKCMNILHIFELFSVYCKLEDHTADMWLFIIVYIFNCIAY